MIEADLVADLKANAGTTKIYLDKAPQAAQPPYVVIQQVGKNPEYDFDGVNGLKAERFEIASYGSSALAALTLSNTIEARYSGQSYAWSSTNVQGAFVASSTSGEDDLTGYFVRQIDIRFHFSDT